MINYACSASDDFLQFRKADDRSIFFSFTYAHATIRIRADSVSEVMTRTRHGIGKYRRKSLVSNCWINGAQCYGNVFSFNYSRFAIKKHTALMKYIYFEPEERRLEHILR